MIRMVWGLGVAAACGLAGAADIFVDDGERRRVDVEADLVEADRLLVGAACAWASSRTTSGRPISRTGIFSNP